MFSYISYVATDNEGEFNSFLICPTETREQSLAEITKDYVDYKIINEITDDQCFINSCELTDEEITASRLTIREYNFLITLPIHPDFLSWFDQVGFDDTQAYMIIGQTKPYFICLPIDVWQDFQRFMFLNIDTFRQYFVSPVGLPIDE